MQAHLENLEMKFIYEGHVRIVGVDEKNRCLAVLITFHRNFKLLVVDVYLPCSEPG